MSTEVIEQRVAGLNDEDDVPERQPAPISAIAAVEKGRTADGRMGQTSQIGAASCVENATENLTVVVVRLHIKPTDTARAIRIRWSPIRTHWDLGWREGWASGI